MVTSPLAVRGFLGGQLRRLRQSGFEVTVVSAPGGELAGYAEREGVACRAIAMERETALWGDLVALWKMWRLLRQIRPAISNVGTPKAGLLGGLAAWLAGVPCRIYTLHGLRLETASGVRRRVLTLAEKIACRLADRVVCVSPSLARRAVELGLARAEDTVVLAAGSANGVDVARFALSPGLEAAAAELRAQWGIPPDAPVVGFVGRLTRDKGVDDLVKAFEQLKKSVPEARLLLVGECEAADPLAAGTQRAIAQDPRITSAGFVSDPAPYYQVMEVVALPSYREGFPTVVLEAGAAGKAVVAARATGTVDAVVEGETGLLTTPGDSAELAQALSNLLADPALAAGMGRRGRRRVEREFTQQRVWKALLALYGEMLARHRARNGRLQRPSGQWVLFAVKRSIDIVGAVLGLVAAGPLMLLAAAIRLTMGAPVLFRQRRPGLGEKLFPVLKFRTMSDERDAAGGLLGDGDRLTTLGGVLRRFSIDELPQLWNVLQGEMSLCGPRPLLERYLQFYTPRERRRHWVRPGLTGWAQLHGRNRLGWNQRLELDVWYVDHWSLTLDLKILWKTLGQVLRGRGFQPNPSAAMPDLDVERGRLLGAAR